MSSKADEGKRKKREKGFKFGIREKILIIFLIIITISTAVTGYLGSNTLDSADKAAVSITRDELTSSAETDLMFLAEDKAHEVGEFCSEVARDTAGSASYVYHAFTDDTYADLTYKGDLYANFGYADWKHEANRNRINGILDGTITDPMYDELLAICDDANDTKLNTALRTLAAGSYAERPASHKKASRINGTLWSKLMSVNTLVKVNSKKGTCDQFLLYNFMYGLLTKEAQNEIDQSLIAEVTIRSQIDSHDDYDMVRLDYWGNTTYSTSLIYSKKPIIIPLPFHNIYYCPKNKAVREKGEGLGPVWTVIGCTGEPSMTCTVPVCRAPLEPLSEENKMVGAVTYWTDLTTLSARIASITVEETGYAFMVNDKGLAIAHPDARMLEIDLTAGETEFNTAVKKMVEGRSGIERITHEGKPFYIAYAPVDITGWSIALMAPFEEVIQPAVDVASEMDEKTNTLYLYLSTATILIIMLAALVGYVVASTLTKPITDLAEGTKAISKGDLSHRIEIDRKDEFGELATAFNHMTVSLQEHIEKLKERTAEVEKLLRHKDEFITQLGHDLKTPLAPLVSLLPMVEKREKDPKSKELLEVTIHSVNYMKDLVIKTLQIARLSSPDVERNIEDINLLQGANNVIGSEKYIVKEKGIKIENKINDKISVKADKQRFEELFGNIVTNAVKFTPDGGGTITIDAKEDKDFITVSVKDTGIGITGEQLEHIFDEFYKADESRHELDSSGLGLSICKRIVEQHGGKIRAESQGQGMGTTIYFTLKSGDE
ncbi:MAG: ATP-binding protein [Euryarchaeota archaeon]|nr:ATP-binding protein [Euryarchaeota archaeon]